MAVENSENYTFSGEALETVLDGTTSTVQTAHYPISDNSEQLYADGTEIEDVTDVSYVVRDYATGEFDVTNESGADVDISADYLYPGNPYSTVDERDISTVPEADVESGSSTKDMAVWNGTQAEIYATVSLLPQEDWTNESQFVIFDSPEILSPTWATYGVKETDPAQDPPVVEVEDGFSIADMDIWNEEQEAKYAFFSAVPKTEWTDQSSFGVFDSPAVLSPTYAEYSTQGTSEAQSDAPDSILYGHLGSDMAVWGLSTEERYAFFSGIPVEDYQPFNESSYAIFRDSVVLSPEYARWPTLETTVADELVPAGAEIGPRVQYSVSFSGNVYLVEDTDEPQHPIEVDGATVTIGAEDNQARSDVTGFMGNYGVSAPTGGSTRFNVVLSHPSLPERELSVDLDEGAEEYEADYYMEYPASRSGMAVGGGVALG